ncbi:MAG: phosphocholine cytidylyltransferase family protein [Terracidiphilus sp.]
MKAILLAAGRGTRISRCIDGKPKCTIPLGEAVTLIEYTIDLFHRNGIADVTVVLGYQGYVIRAILAGRNVRFVENPFYDVTNSIASLWFARSTFAACSDFLIMNGDVFLSQQALDAVLEEDRSPVLFYDTTRREGADYKFQCDGDRLVQYGKDLSLDETSGEYIGCARFGSEFTGTFVARLEELIRTQSHSMWWEDVLYSLTPERGIIARDLAGAFWGEVDYIEDYERITAYCREHAEDILPVCAVGGAGK